MVKSNVFVHFGIANGTVKSLVSGLEELVHVCNVFLDMNLHFVYFEIKDSLLDQRAVGVVVFLGLVMIFDCFLSYFHVVQKVLINKQGFLQVGAYLFFLLHVNPVVEDHELVSDHAAGLSKTWTHVKAFLYRSYRAN